MSFFTPRSGNAARECLKGVTEEATYGGILSCFHAPSLYRRDLANADVAVLGIPFDLATPARARKPIRPYGVGCAR